MTESEPQESARLTPYDELRQSDFIPKPLREQWATLDFHRQAYQDKLLRLERDGDLSDEAKVRRATELSQGEGPKIEREGKDLKAALLKAAEQSQRASLPIPSGESLNPSDPTKVLISQLEAARISRRIDRAESKPGPFKPDARDVLADEYKAGMKMGDTRGGAIIRGALMVAEERGLGDDWVPRRERDAEFVDSARQLSYTANWVPVQPPGVPRSLQPPRRLSRRPEQRRDSGFIFAPGAGGLITKRDESGHTGLGGSHEAAAELPEESPTGKRTLPKKKTRTKAWK
jgi:hypothetical protein